MTDADQLLSIIRSRNVLKDIAEGLKRRMPCGDSRLAERMRGLGILRLINPAHREVTTSWIVTDFGQQKYEEIYNGQR